jgi:hypothetical protein
MGIKAKHCLRQGWMITASLALVLFNYGCGKIGDPIPPGFSGSQTMTTFSAPTEKDSMWQRSNSTVKDKR